MIFCGPNGKGKMIRRFILRGIAIFPVSCSVLLLSIWLFYKLPGVHGLDTTSLELGSDREIQHLFWNFDREHLPMSGQGIFYFGFLRKEVPKIYYHIPAPFQMAFLSLSKEVKNRNTMKSYGEWMVSMIRDLIYFMPQKEGEYRVIVDLFMSTTLEDFVEQAENLDSEELNKIALEMKTAAPVTASGYRSVWLGRENLLHYYLTGILSWKNDLRTRHGISVKEKISQVFPWTLAYTLPVIPVIWVLMYGFVLWFYDRGNILKRLDRLFVLIYSFPTFIIATLALIFFTSNRYGWISNIFPYPIFMAENIQGLSSIYKRYFYTLLLPMFLFGLRPMILLFRVFQEKIKEVSEVGPESDYLIHMGISPKRFRIDYLGRYLMVETWAMFSGLFVAALSGSMIIEYIFNIPGLGRFFYESVIEYDVASSVFLIFVFTVIQQIGHLLSDYLIDFYLASRLGRTKLA